MSIRSIVMALLALATSAAVASVISSHANRNAITPFATNTISTEPSSTLKPAPTAAMRDGGMA